MIREERWLLEEKYGGERSAAYGADLARLASGEPVAYVIGTQPFLGLDIHLDSKPLIPRVETEWWTNELLDELTKRLGAFAERPERDGAGQGGCSAENHAAPHTHSTAQFLDLCAGSGAIGCAALARLANARVSFGELDPAHEATIRKNVRENGLDESRTSVHIGDLFEPFGDRTFDVIAANPPYVPSGRALPASVGDYEPAAALFAGEDGLAVIRRIAAGLPSHLAQGGVAWIEIDRGHAAQAAMLFRERGFDARIRTDQYGKPRVAVVSWPQ